MFKVLMANRYRKTYEALLAKLASGAVLHADETEVKLRTGKGYVWVFANIEEVVYVFKPNRRGEFLKDFLHNFHGVLISDFYAAYDGINCPQQKCLIHLMRDLNQDLLAGPFDEGVRSLTQLFGTLLREIVNTVDEYGLRHKRLVRHRRDVDEFFERVSSLNLTTGSSQAIRERLLKYRDKLFTFIDYDGVPWNNNNAENAIKMFAYYRENRVSVMKEAGLEDYLVLLSICQTCRCKGISFLQFLISGERDVDSFATRNRHERRPTGLQFYSKAFVPPHLASLRARKRKQSK
jgi:hypothetical protein